MIRLVHLRRAPAEEKDVEWLGTWATYSFRHSPVRPAPDTALTVLDRPAIHFD
jgi:hypothetical protein